MWKLLLTWFVVVMSSPVVVDFSKDIFEVSGWLAIGTYNFNFAEGLFRSATYFIITCPVIASIYLSKPTNLGAHREKRIQFKSHIKKYHIYLMMIFCIIVFMFDLGITGVEKDTGGWRLSGIVHYVRSYFFMIIIGLYIFASKNPSFRLIVLYAFVAGLTSGSRFVICSPIALYLVRSIIEKKSPKEIISAVFILVIAFASVTAQRQILYFEDYTFLKIFVLFNELDISAIEVFNRGLTELFMRLGIGRDVILAYEVRDSAICNDYYRLFFDGGSCRQPALDFYGFVNDQTRFGIDPPMLASLVASMYGGAHSFIFLIFYSLWAYILCKAGRNFSKMRSLRLISWPVYYLQIVFVTIGPIRYAIYIYLVSLLIVLAWFILFLSPYNRHRLTSS